MKKVFALTMAMVMLLTLVACGQGAGANTNTVQPETTEETVDKQALYEDFFTKENFKTAGESMRIGNEQAEIAVVKDNSDNRMLEIRVLENYIRIYQLQEGKQYINLKMTDEEGNEEDAWTEYKSEEAEDAIESTDMDLSATKIDLDAITRVEYVETKDGKDLVKVYQKNPEYNEKVEITEYNITFQYNGEECEIIVTTEVDAEGGMGTSYETVSAPEEFDIFYYTPDFENKVLVNDTDENDKIPFEINEQKSAAPEAEISYDVTVDVATKAVTSMQGVFDGEAATVEFFSVESCLDGVKIPETVEACNEEDLAMAIFAVLFSAVEFETE